MSIGALPIEALGWLREVYSSRRCFVCRAKGWCGHREPLVDMAELVASMAAACRGWGR